MEGLYNWGGPVSFDLWQRVCRLCAVSVVGKRKEELKV